MIAVYLTTCFIATFSAFVPVTAIEPYVVGVAATTGCSPVGLGLAAAIGQTAGKTTVFLGARGALRSARLRRWVGAAKARVGRRRGEVADRARLGQGHPEPDAGADLDQVPDRRAEGRTGPFRAAAKRLTEQLDRPVLTAPILFLSAVFGIPPLLATCVYTANTRISVSMFVVVCLAGRSIRFIALAYAPYLILS
ncbi:hypothetical protein [Glycomyces buryatensis]|uniref:VTT domain-containing protein n=1 Tax=Glycomyces buryatensis TaxID=2570927 RepID=A0A4S8QCG2_9ACTN|nr:hypothetical protein [Glycomyces buryatensis]THV40672.1 hypothetical protein FAB82_15560 [Glycomyces buryatensis]